MKKIICKSMEYEDYGIIKILNKNLYKNNAL